LSSPELSFIIVIRLHLIILSGMTLMYPKISFADHQDYFKQSDIYQHFFDNVIQKLKTNDKPKVVQASIQLFMESVIKHNLDVNMLTIDFINFVTEDNSKVVKDIFGPIVLYKNKHDKTDKDYQILKVQGHISNNIALYCLMEINQDHDVCAEIKEEFGNYVLAKKQNTAFKPKVVK
jgi:hypothetical protein